MGLDIAKLFARIGIKADTKPLHNFMDSLKSAKINLGLTTIGLAGVSVAIKALMNDAMNTALAFKQFKAETGESAEELQRWTAVADQVNNSGQDVSAAIKSITANQEKLKLGQGSVAGYSLLGIDPRQSPLKIMDELRTKTAGFNQAMKKNVLEQMGISRNLIQVLELTNDEFKSMKSNAFVIPDSAIEQIDAARASTKQLQNALQFFKGILASQLAPTIIKINKGIMEWIKSSKNSFIPMLKTSVEWLFKIISAVVNAALMINKIITATIGWKGAIMVLIGVFAILNAALLLSPIGLITAGIILLVAVLDDLYVYSKGGKSLFGKLLEKNKGLKQLVDDIKSIAAAFTELFSFGTNKKFDELIEKWGVFGKIIEGIANALKITKEFFTGDMNALDERKDKAKDETDKLKKMSNKEYFQYLKESFTGKKASDQGNTLNITNNNTVNIQGNADKDKVSDGMNDALTKANKQLDLQLSRGGAK